MTIQPDMERAEVPVMLVPKPVINATTVATLLNRTEGWFHNRRVVMEERYGFPPKLPGMAGWSYACVMRWIETNGQTFLPADNETPPAAGRDNRLEARYAQ
jgi:hypothetical protein